MAAVLGLVGEAGTLPLVTGSDYQYGFRWQDPLDATARFPPGSELYYLLGAPGEPNQKWSFTINADSATIRIESEVADLVEDRTGFRLVYRQASTTPTTETVLVFGKVKRYEPR